MTGDPIARLRRADPARDGGHAPAFDDVMGRVRRETAGEAPVREARRYWLSGVGPLVAVAATAAIVVVVVVAVSHHRSPVTRPAPAPPASTPAARVPSPASLLPSTGGMRGLVFFATVVGANATLHASFVQCTNCRGNTTPPNAREVNWSSVSTDGGAHWQTHRDRTSLLQLGLALPDGPNVWEYGYPPHAGNPGFYASHDSGRTFQAVAAPSKSGDVATTLGGGQAWTLGTGCVRHGQRYYCRSSVLHGSAGGSRLAETTAQPPGMPVRVAPTELLVAGYGQRGYVSQASHHRLYTTDDDGQSWTAADYPCSSGREVQALTATMGGTLWATCGPTQRRGTPLVTVWRSSDGGRRWQKTGPALHGATVVAVSPQAAWASEPDGVLRRTSNAGRSWTTVLHGLGPTTAIQVQSATTATAVVIATAGTAKANDRRTDLVAYRTTDAGAHWAHAVVNLPTG